MYGYRYFLTIVDDCSRFTWVYMLHTKDDVQSIIPQFFENLHTQLGLTIKGVRSDNAKELNLTKFYNSKGVTHYHSCVERP